jgi:hypothetical protein
MIVCAYVFLRVDIGAPLNQCQQDLQAAVLRGDEERRRSILRRWRQGESGKEEDEGAGE